MPERHAYYIKTEGDECVVVVVNGADIGKAVRRAEKYFETKIEHDMWTISEVEHLGIAIVA